ncbi:hydroxycinnamoyl-Coenzyme A shikimate quinate hydroxycinnamoyltransferase-like [Musa troglodytarum]|uniref:Hydroxycinnamoyl-Coenzyme A shikimate quinate hydroxycinnamoyltransferase-like n=1 Tax=Musa troglodytarum TaxID=320322 RepID=A0A9E7G6S6_9LILI|nr:hydroxycinnamoyl-Coenzyme A shikimate quinate hydroxycinnamoyltransferase-like [Musa troglodytarum]
METYFSNAVTVTFDNLRVADLTSMELGEVADVVHAMIMEVATREQFLEFIDWIEQQRPEAVRSKIYREEEGDGAAVKVSSGMRFPVAEVDFGWRRLASASYHFSLA